MLQKDSLPHLNTAAFSDEAIFDEAEVWPIEINWPNKRGFTLWAQTSDDDLLLATDGQILLFEEFAELGKFVASDKECNLSHLPGYQAIQQVTRQTKPDWDDLELEYYFYDFNTVQKRLAAGNWGEWTLEECVDTLDVLNTLWDMAVTLNDGWAGARLEAGTLVGTLPDKLTYITEEEIPKLAQFDSQAIAQEYEQILERLDPRIKIVE